jgi:hypothetical protein
MDDTSPPGSVHGACSTDHVGKDAEHWSVQEGSSCRRLPSAFGRGASSTSLQHHSNSIPTATLASPRQCSDCRCRDLGSDSSRCLIDCLFRGRPLASSYISRWRRVGSWGSINTRRSKMTNSYSRRQPAQRNYINCELHIAVIASIDQYDLCA